MPKTRNPYPPEFREQIVALARAGRSVVDLAREFEPCAATIHGWVKQADRDGGRRSDGLTSRCDCSTRRMISSFSAAGYLMRRPPHPRSRFF
ncbi:MAG: transposase [Bauldia sp.]|nr:transposase [Bauldia sp.]